MKNKNINASVLTKAMNISSDMGRSYSPNRAMPPKTDELNSSLNRSEKDIFEERKNAFLKKRKDDREKLKEENKKRSKKTSRKSPKKDIVKSEKNKLASKVIEKNVSSLIEGVCSFTDKLKDLSKEYPDRRDVQFRLDKMSRMNKMYIKAMNDLVRKIK